jgi:hypothetical protein
MSGFPSGHKRFSDGMPLIWWSDFAKICLFHGKMAESTRRRLRNCIPSDYYSPFNVANRL